MTLHSLTEFRTFEEAFDAVRNSPDWNARPEEVQQRIAKEAARRIQRENDQ
jgi:hypothetical protein